MCGIIGYIGKQNAVPIVLEGLKRLEYRGYDSGGICGLVGEKVQCVKIVGRINSLEEKVAQSNLEGSCFIGHTRWATHGKPSEKNAHPHSDCTGKIWLVHNGIIENYQELKEELIAQGHKFTSVTDTEVLAHLIEKMCLTSEVKQDATSEVKHIFLEDAVREALKQVQGTYGLAVISQDEPGKIVVAKNSSPLLIGVGEHEFIVASDASAVISHTRQVIYLGDKEIGVLTPEGFRITTLDEEPVKKDPSQIEWDAEQVKKAGFAHFMLKEIFEQPEVIKNSLRGRLIEEKGLAKLGGLESQEEILANIKRIIIVAMGTAYNAGLIGEYMLEEYTGIPVEVENAAEFRYRKPVLDSGTVVLAVSQSGETADTLAGIGEAKKKEITTLGIVNVVGSSISRTTDAGVYNHIGPEIGVASTKAFTSQLAILALFTLFLGRQRKMSLDIGRRVAKELALIPEKIKRILAQNDRIKKIAKKYSDYENFLYLGRKYNFPIALEGALKLKEISYVHAEGYSAAEMKHGAIALVDKKFPSFGIIPTDSVYEKTRSNLEEIKARGGKIVVVATEGNNEVSRFADEAIFIPKTLEMLTPILAVIPLQLFAYYIGVARGCDVDKPRNLAKSVTVE